MKVTLNSLQGTSLAPAPTRPLSKRAKKEKERQKLAGLIKEKAEKKREGNLRWEAERTACALGGLAVEASPPSLALGRSEPVLSPANPPSTD